MTKRYLINVELIESSGVALTIAELPGLFIFGQTADDAVGKRARVVPERLVLGNCTDAPDTDAIEWLCAASLAHNANSRPFGHKSAKRWLSCLTRESCTS